MDLAQVAHQRNIFSESAEKLSTTMVRNENERNVQKECNRGDTHHAKEFNYSFLVVSCFFGSLPSSNTDKTMNNNNKHITGIKMKSNQKLD